MDANGILTVSAEEKTTGKKQNITITNDGSRLSADDIEKMVEEAEKFKEEDEQVRKLQEARNKFENYLYQMKQTIEDDSLKSKLGDDYEKIKENLQKLKVFLMWRKCLVEEYDEMAQQELEQFINSIMQNIVKDGGGEFASGDGQTANAPPSPPQDVPSEPPIEEID